MAYRIKRASSSYLMRSASIRLRLSRPSPISFSKWVMMNQDTRKLQWVTDEVREEYLVFCPRQPRYDPSTDSYHDNMEGNGILCLAVDILSTEFSKEIPRDWEAEMQRLKLELKQTMDMYSIACKEQSQPNKRL